MLHMKASIDQRLNVETFFGMHVCVSVYALVIALSSGSTFPKHCESLELEQNTDIICFIALLFSVSPIPLFPTAECSFQGKSSDKPSVD